MLAVVIVFCALVVALPFLLRLQRGAKAVSRAAHFELRARAVPASAEGSAMRAATTSLAARTRPAPLIVVHRYRRHCTVSTGLTVIGKHPERIAALIADAAGATAETVDDLDLPKGAVVRYGRRARHLPHGTDIGPDAFGRWVTSVLAGATADAVLSIGVTPASRWETLSSGDTTATTGWRGRIVAAAGDPITADALAAGCGTQLRDFPIALSARRPGDAPVVAAGAALAVLTGLITAAEALVSLHPGAALAAVEAGGVAASILAAVGSTGCLRVTESCWRHWQRSGVVIPERPWRLSARRAAVQHRDATEAPTTRRTVAFSADQWASLCTPGPAGDPRQDAIDAVAVVTPGPR
jgi:hypothetical protein